MNLNIIKILLICLFIITHQINTNTKVNQDGQADNNDNKFDQPVLDVDKDQSDKDKGESKKVGNSQEKNKVQEKVKKEENIVVNEKQEKKIPKQGQKKEEQKKKDEEKKEEPEKKEPQKKEQQKKVQKKKVEQKKVEQKKVEQKEEEKVVQKPEFHEVIVPDEIKIDDPEAKAQHTIQQQQIQIQKQKQQTQQIEGKIKPWILAQIQNSEESKTGLVYQTLQFILQPYEQYIFRWNPPQNDKLQLSITVYEVTTSGQIINYMNNAIDEYILVQNRYKNNNIFQQIGKVYFARVFSIDFDTDHKQFKMTNNLRTKVCVSVELEKRIQTVSKLNVATDDHFSVPLKKIEIIQQQVVSQEKLREHSYKWQWGFLQNHYHHQTNMLGFTGMQLLIIMGSTLVQLYFIKSLLDNRAIV